MTQADSFDVLHFNEDVLRIYFLRNNEMRKKLKKPVVDNFDDRARRFTAYGQFLFWIYEKRMTKGQRKILPACAYAAIRKKFPAQSQDYSDFVPGENEDIYM